MQLLHEQVGVGGAVNDSSALSSNASDESISITSRSCIWAGVESVDTQRCWENKELAIGTGVEDRWQGTEGSSISISGSILSPDSATSAQTHRRLPYSD